MSPFEEPPREPASEAERQEDAGDAAAEAAPRAAGRDAKGARRSHPGTGWGRRVGDRAVVVDFDAAPHPAERIALRYEYRDALRALGVLPRHDDWERLRQRERGETGFARPPR